MEADLYRLAAERRIPLLDSSSKFPDEADANAADPLLASIKDSQVRAWAGRRRRRRRAPVDIRLQGDQETSFLASEGGGLPGLGADRIRSLAIERRPTRVG